MLESWLGNVWSWIVLKNRSTKHCMCALHDSIYRYQVMLRLIIFIVSNLLSSYCKDFIQSLAIILQRILHFWLFWCEIIDVNPYVYMRVCGCMQKSAQNSSSVIWVEVIFKCQKYISLVRFSPRNTRQKIKWWALKNILTFKLNKTFILIFLKTYFGHKMK